ncbi:MAG: ABC transporter, partial [Rhizobium leguminosarum]|nr:ABC transporter [Rhizobium leguminosarum]
MTLAKTFKIALFSLLGLSAIHGPAAAEADAPLLPKVPSGTVLTIGDPVTQKALEVSGLGKELSFEVKWANISGGPQTSEAF